MQSFAGAMETFAGSTRGERAVWRNAGPPTRKDAANDDPTSERNPMMTALGVLVLVVAVTAAITLTADRVPAKLIVTWFFLSFMGQMFAAPLALLAAVLALTTASPARFVLALAAVLFVCAHIRNRRAGRIFLDAVGLEGLKIPPFAGLTPFLVGESKIRRVKGLAYGDAGERNMLDLVMPRTPPSGQMPILIHVHGGGWVVGDKNQQAKPLLNRLAARGWLCVDLTYRLGPAERGPAWIVDVLKAIAWVRANAASYGGDPARIAITGGSAGGHLAALAALAHDDPAFKPGFEDADCSVAMAAPIYGRYDFLDRAGRSGRNRKPMIDFVSKNVMPGPPEAHRELWRAVSPLDRVRPDAPPMLIAHGTGDSMLPHGEARDFVAKLRAVSGSAVVHVELPGIQHGWDMANSALAWAQACALEAFLAPLAKPR